MKYLAAALWFFLATPLVFALEITSVDSVTVTVTYTEPTTKADGSPLDDLSYTTIYYDEGNGWEEVAVVPASQPTGGADISQQVTIPIPDGTEVDVFVTATATDDANNESEYAVPATARLDTLAPAAPQ